EVQPQVVRARARAWAWGRSPSRPRDTAAPGPERGTTQHVRQRHLGPEVTAEAGERGGRKCRHADRCDRGSMCVPG
ncbi:hypothetical protein chiPu_0027292, partial [Chiloscyllium punctatum]|nr:hypothetical protein [Chiloscyllium punctatum]